MLTRYKRFNDAVDKLEIQLRNVIDELITP